MRSDEYLDRVYTFADNTNSSMWMDAEERKLFEGVDFEFKVRREGQQQFL